MVDAKDPEWEGIICTRPRSQLGRRWSKCSEGFVTSLWNFTIPGTGLGLRCLQKSHNFVSPKLVPNPFFGEYSLDFGKYRLKFMACVAENYLHTGDQGARWLRLGENR